MFMSFFIKDGLDIDISNVFSLLLSKKAWVRPEFGMGKQTNQPKIA